MLQCSSHPRLWFLSPAMSKYVSPYFFVFSSSLRKSWSYWESIFGVFRLKSIIWDTIVTKSSPSTPWWELPLHKYEHQILDLVLISVKINLMLSLDSYTSKKLFNHLHQRLRSDLMESINQSSINQSVSQSISHSTNHSINQSINQSVN